MSLENNKYARCYQALVAKRQSIPVVGYAERHHIIPKCMGGTDEPSNLVALTAREHFIAHLLLVKAVPKHFRSKLAHAFWLMAHMKSKNQERHYRINSASYKAMRELHAQAARDRRAGRVLSKEEREAYKGPKSDSHRQAMSIARTGMVFADGHRKNLSAAVKGKRWVSRAGKTKMVSSETISSLLADGWVLGREGWRI